MLPPSRRASAALLERQFNASSSAVALAVGCVLGQLLILEQHDRRSEEILTVHAAAYEKELADLEDDIRVGYKTGGIRIERPLQIPVREEPPTPPLRPRPPVGLIGTALLLGAALLYWLITR